jgi:HK97 family phage major capsid protein
MKRIRRMTKHDPARMRQTSTNRCPGQAISNAKMKPKYPFLSATLLIVALTTSLFLLHAITPAHAIGLLLLGQLVMFALSNPSVALFVGGFTKEQMEEFEELMKSLGQSAEQIKLMPGRLKKLEDQNDELRGELRKFRKTSMSLNGGSAVRWIGNQAFVSDECAESLTATMVAMLCGVENGLERMIPDSHARRRIADHAKAIIGLQGKAALDPTSTPLPTIYAPQIIELVFAYGQARQWATIFPLGAGTVKLPRLKAGEDDFGYIGIGTAGMSQAIPEKKVSAELVTFTANKAGGLIRIPTELEEDTFIPIGQFLARYIARQLAKLEDKTLFLADGTATYANQSGVGTYCAANGSTYLKQLAGGKTKPSDATLADFRAMRPLVSPAVLANMAANGQTNAAYYMHPSMEALLVTFNTLNNPLIYQRSTNGQPAMLDGFPIRWIGPTQPYSAIASPSTFLAFFGDLSYWYLGERGTPRVEISREVFFATDELAMRAIERIDVETAAIDAMSALQTAAA